MSDYSDAEQASNRLYSAGTGSVGSPINRGGSEGHVSFARSDGPASITIHGGLTPGAAIKLETFLRALLAEDAPALLAQRQADMERSHQEQIKAAVKSAGTREKLRAALAAEDARMEAEPDYGPQ